VSADGKTFKTYCKLTSAAKLSEEGTAVYYVSGFERYADYKAIAGWLAAYEAKVKGLDDAIKSNNGAIDGTVAAMKAISDRVNILNYFEKHPDSRLLTELRLFWIPVSYRDPAIAATEGATLADKMELAKLLMESGRNYLSKHSKPRYDYTIDSCNFIFLHEFHGSTTAP
jgi:hypothetical protein